MNKNNDEIRIDEPICPDCDTRLEEYGEHYRCGSCGWQFKRVAVEYEWRALEKPNTESGTNRSDNE